MTDTARKEVEELAKIIKEGCRVVGIEHLSHFIISAGYKRPQDNNTELIPLDEKKLLVYLLGITPRSVPLDREEIESLAKRICAKFGKDNSGMVNPQEDIIPSCLCKVPEINHCDERKINGSKCVKCGGIIRFPNPIISQQPPKERKVSLEEIEKVMHERFFKDGVKEMNPYDAKRIKSYAQAILSLIEDSTR